MKKRHARTVRLRNGQQEALIMVAAVEGISTNEAIVRAIEAYIENRRADTLFQKRLAYFLQQTSGTSPHLADT